MDAPESSREDHRTMPAPTDLESQFETLLDCVWEAEKNWDLMDRIDLALKVPPSRRIGSVERQDR